jgi:sialic acid synthase SpsE
MNPSHPIPGTTRVLGGEDVFVVAEIGKNFIQSADERPVTEYLANAKALIAAAADSGADAVKFQTHVVEDEQLDVAVISPHFKASDRYSWVARNERVTPPEFWAELKAYSDAYGILFFSTPMSRKAARKLDKIGMPLWKIGSGDVFDHVLLNEVATPGKPLIISSGMVSLAELDGVVNDLRGKQVPLCLLYCVSRYPCPKEDFNLATIELFREKYPDVVIGFSDHSVDGHAVDLAAVKLGARVIEKHFSFSRGLWGSDHKASVTPQELGRLVADLRSDLWRSVDVTPFYGLKSKELEGASSEFRPYFFKSLMAASDFPAGMTLDKESVFAMRPQMFARGLPSQDFEFLLGKKLSRDLKKFDPVTLGALES